MARIVSNFSTADQQLLLRKPFHDQYTLLIEMESMLINSFLQSKTEIRYDFSVLHVGNDGVECRLVQLDLFIKETNSPLIREVGEVTAAFNRMFSELHLQLDSKGKVIAILNLDLILSKWKQTKTALQTAASQNDDLQKLILLNDVLFTNPEQLVKAVQANEFLSVYFADIFGINLPVANQYATRTNFLNTAYLDWCSSVQRQEPSASQQPLTVITTSGTPCDKLGQDFIKNAYKQFEQQLDVSNFHPTLSETATHMVDATSGWVNQASINRKEVAEPQKLYTRLQYTLSSDKAKG